MTQMEQTLPPLGLVHMTVMTGSCVLGKSTMLRVMTEQWHEYSSKVDPQSVDHVLPYVMYEMIGRSVEDMYQVTEDSAAVHEHLYRSDSCQAYAMMTREMRATMHEYHHTISTLTKKFARMRAQNEPVVAGECGNAFETSYNHAVKGWIEKLLDRASQVMHDLVYSGHEGEDAAGRYMPIILDRWPQLDSEAFRMASIAIQNPTLYAQMKETGQAMNTRAEVLRDCATHLINFVTKRRCLLAVDVIHCRPSTEAGAQGDPSHVTFEDARQEQPRLDPSWKYAYPKPRPSRWDMYKRREVQNKMTEPPSLFCDTKEAYEKFLNVLDVEIEAVYDEFIRYLSANAQRIFMETHDAFFANAAGKQRKPWTMDKLMRLRDMWAFARRGSFNSMLEGDPSDVAKNFTQFYVDNHQRYVRRWVPYLLEWRGVRVTWPARGLIPFMPTSQESTRTAACAASPKPSTSAGARLRPVEEESKSENAADDDSSNLDAIRKRKADDEEVTTDETASSVVKRPCNESRILAAAEVLAYCGGQCSQASVSSSDTIEPDELFERWSKKIVPATPQSPSVVGVGGDVELA